MMFSALNDFRAIDDCVIVIEQRLVAREEANVFASSESSTR
jgi:hypothetical protein